ncbi:hypothetical protein B296_00040814 [Ensete ventricosum]|uniref:Uncharacterized protein n=1 Tax=Ensete ventricosum TaxID=4639 RepID=A0A426YAV2_ENSVE|nr:hypothetical protein B296_00040814 [Ensete ventricosum]
MIRATTILDYFSTYIRLRELDKSEDKVELANAATKEAKENRISMSLATRWQRPCMGVTATDSRVMGSAVPWYYRDGTSVELSIPCSHGGRALVIIGAEEVENAEANFQYHDRAEG